MLFAIVLTITQLMFIHQSLFSLLRAFISMERDVPTLKLHKAFTTGPNIEPRSKQVLPFLRTGHKLPTSKAQLTAIEPTRKEASRAHGMDLWDMLIQKLTTKSMLPAHTQAFSSNQSPPFPCHTLPVAV